LLGSLGFAERESQARKPLKPAAVAAGRRRE
jgi:hypothetical protein